MEYNRIIAITGLGGLFELLSSKSDGAIVKSLEDQQTRFVSSRVHNFSHLESIEVYTTRENINLVDLFNAIKSSGEALPAEKDAAAVKAFFVKVYPDLDFDRIYNSDMKKMVRWYALLSDNHVEFKLSAEEPAEEQDGEEAEAVAAEESPKAAKAKAKAPETTAGAADAAPAAKKAAKTAPAEKEEAPAAKKAAKPAAKAAPAEEAPAEEAPAAKKAAKPAATKTDDKKADDKKKAAPKKK